MTKQNVFYITDFQIDLSRSVVIASKQEVQVEPKVLQVLLLLAKRQNEVVTHKEIMDHVWQGTEVVPNALQRCIAILRKVLNDNAKSPTIIATHPRIGYRLLADVRWQALPNLHTSVESLAKEVDVSTKSSEKQDKTHWLKFAVSLIFLAGLIIIVAAITIWPDEHPSQYTKIRQLTLTDPHENHALFSPNMQYLVFNRYAGACKSHLWAKHITSGKENRLTFQPGHYGVMSFTGDGRELIFAAKKNCDKLSDKQKNQLSRQSCWNIATLDFSLALSTPEMPKFRHQCQAERLEKPKALSNHQYAFLQYNNGRYQLMHYDDLSKKTIPLYFSDQLYLYHFDYDSLSKRFAVISRDNHFNHIVEVLDEKGKLLSHKKIQLTEEMSQNQYFKASFEPQGQYLLAISNESLYRIELNGQLQKITTPESNLISAVKHPKNHSLLAVKGKKDIDVAQLTLGDKSVPQPVLELNSQLLPFTSFARSSAQERRALYQPYGERIAFISDRSGQDQLWLWHEGQAAQFSFSPSQSSIDNFSWSPDGNYLAWVSNDGLAIADLKGEVQLFNTDKPLYSVLSWYTENQLLVLVNDPEPGGLYRLDINKHKLSAFDINQVEAAWVNHDQLFYSNVNAEVFTRPLNKDKSKSKRLAGLNGKALFINEHSIYSVDKNSFILNQFTLQGELLKPVMPLNSLAWKVTDLKDNQLLLSQFIAINHDIVMLE